MDNPEPGTSTIAPLSSGAMQDTTSPLRFNEIRVITGPSSHLDGTVLSARIETSIKLHISFHPGSPIKFLKLPKTPSVHSDNPAPEQCLKFSLEVRRAAGGNIIQSVCSKCEKRKAQATSDMVDFKAKSTTIDIQNGIANVEFSIKCYAQHHGLDHHAFRVDAILQDHDDNVIDHAQLPLLFNISGKGKQPVRARKAHKRAVRGVSAPQHNLSAAGIIPDLQHIDYGIIQGGLTSYLGHFPGDGRQTDNSEQQLPWAESMPGVYSGVDLFSSFNPPTTTLTMGDLQQPVQFPQSGVGPRDIDPQIERDVSLDMVYDRTHAGAVSRSEQTLPVLPPQPVIIPGSISVEPQCGRGVSQTSGVPPRSSHVSNESSSGTSGVPDAPSALHSEQGSSIPNPLMPLRTPQLNVEEPEDTHSGDTNLALSEVFLEEVLPEKGPTTGGIHIALFGENFPSTPLYVAFGDNWVRAKRRDARTLRCRLPSSSKAGVVRVTISQTPSKNAPEVGWSMATFEYEDTQIEAQLSMIRSVYHKADEATLQKTYASVQRSLATMNTHLDLTLSTRNDHPEGAETCPRPEDVNWEEVFIFFLRTYSTHPNWKQIISSCNDYGQTMAHISVTLGQLRLLRHLFTWGINLNAVDNVGLTALHYAYLFKQEHCAKFLIQSGVNRFILDDLGRSPSDLDPSLDVGFHSIMDTDADSHADAASLIEYDTEMLDDVGKLDAKHFLVQEWMRRFEDERRDEAPPSRYQSPKNLGHPRTTSSPRVLDSTDEREWDAMYDRFPSLGVRIPEENSTLIVTEEMDWKESIEIEAPSHIHHPPPPISEASIQSQEADPHSDYDVWVFAHPPPLDGAINTPDLELPQRNCRIRAFRPSPRREPSLALTSKSARPLLPDAPKDIKGHSDTNGEKRLQRSTLYARPSACPQRSMPGSTMQPTDVVALDNALLIRRILFFNQPHLVVTTRADGVPGRTINAEVFSDFYPTDLTLQSRLVADADPSRPMQEPFLCTDSATFPSPGALLRFDAALRPTDAAEYLTPLIPGVYLTGTPLWPDGRACHGASTAAVPYWPSDRRSVAASKQHPIPSLHPLGVPIYKGPPLPVPTPIRGMIRTHPCSLHRYPREVAQLQTPGSPGGSMSTSPERNGVAIPLPRKKELHSAPYARPTTGSFDKTIRIWNADTGAAVGNPLRRTRDVNSVAYSPDGHHIISGSDDGGQQTNPGSSIEFTNAQYQDYPLNGDFSMPDWYTQEATLANAHAHISSSTIDLQLPIPPTPASSVYVSTPGNSGVSPSTSPETSSVPIPSPRKKRLQRSAPYDRPSTSSQQTDPGSSMEDTDAVALENARKGVRHFVKAHPHVLEPCIGDPAAKAIIGSNPSGDKLQFNCHDCAHVDARFSRALRHQRQDHFNHYPFPCQGDTDHPACGQWFSSDEYAEDHVSEAVLTTFPFPECPKVFSNVGNSSQEEDPSCLAEQPGLVVVKTRVTVDDALEHQLFARRYNQ